jgi:flagellin
MIEMTNMLQRMRELAIQSSNDTYTSVDRGYLDLEFQQLKAEVNRISKDTEWNGMGIMNGSVINDDGQVGKFEFQVGANDGQIITHTIAEMGFTTLTGTATLSTAAATTSAPQVSTLTLTGTYLAGDVIEFTMGGETKSYTVAAEDLTSSDNTTNLNSIAAKVLAAAATPMGTIVVAPTSPASNALTFTAGANNISFTASVSHTRGALQNITTINILNNTDSNKSIQELDVGINRINTERAGIGAVINRLTYAVDNLANVSQNSSESRIRIMDADYAKASSELARTQIISQAATAMLAQANQQPQTVLQLLQG